jgi:hypothetical protein
MQSNSKRCKYKHHQHFGLPNTRISKYQTEQYHANWTVEDITTKRILFNLYLATMTKIVNMCDVCIPKHGSLSHTQPGIQWGCHFNFICLWFKGIDHEGPF